MPFDALTLSVLTAELSKCLEKGKITKIMQPEKDEIALQIFNGQNFRLLVSASPSLPRIHLTAETKENPAAAPAFCMLLRKHLSGGQITGIRQQPFERVVVLEISAPDELGDRLTKFLICEVTGKSANIFLTDGDYKILGMLRLNPADSLSDRPALPGQKYAFPSQDKIRPDNIDKIYSVLEKCQARDAKELLREKIMGLSPATLEEIAGGETDSRKIADNFALFLKKLETPAPFIVYGGDGVTPSDVLAVDYITVKGNKKPCRTLNEAFDGYFSGKDAARRTGEKTRQISQILKNAVSRLEKKIALQKETILEARDNDTNRIYGDIILSNFHKIKKGDRCLVAENFYEESLPALKIPLDETLTPQQNAQKYFKKYAKQKRTVEYAEKLLGENEKQLDYIKSIALSLSAPLEAADIAEILNELDALKLVKKTVKAVPKKQNNAVPASRPLSYLIGGYTVLVGKNNAQNDRLTFSTAGPNDVWMHAKNLHSAHAVILNPSGGGEIPDGVLTACGEITAYYSEAKNSSKVAVDYTAKKNVRKPGGSPPGFVTYASYKTCIVNPNPHNENKK